MNRNVRALPSGIIDFEQSCVWYSNGGCCAFSGAEMKVLTRLVAKAGEVVSREQLLGELWGAAGGAVFTRTVDMHVSALRKKLRPATEAQEVLVTVRRCGYMFSDKSESDERQGL